MSNYFDAIPQAVAAIVSTHGHHVFVDHDNADVKEAKLVAFADKLTRTRTFAQALLDKQAGKCGRH